MNNHNTTPEGGPYQEATGPSIRVLVIEDDEVDQQWVRRQLESYPSVKFQTVLKASLEEALPRLDSPFFDAVVLDLNLPDSHGGETILRTLLHATQLPMVVLTGNRDHHLSDSARQRGVYAYLVKGAGSMDVLARTLHEAVMERRARQAEEMDPGSLA